MTAPSGRFARFLRVAVNTLLTPAKDPRTVYADPAQQQRGLLEQVRMAQQRLAATRTRLEEQRAAAVENARRLENQARQALTAGHDDLARLALRRERIVLTEIAHLEGQIGALQREEEQLATIDQRLSARIDALRAREQMAAARHTAARAQIAVGEALSGVAEMGDDGARVERIERDADELEARAGAIDELIGHRVLGGEPSLAADFPGDADIEERLAALRQDVATMSPHAKEERS